MTLGNFYHFSIFVRKDLIERTTKLLYFFQIFKSSCTFKKKKHQKFYTVLKLPPKKLKN